MIRDSSVPDRRHLKLSSQQNDPAFLTSLETWQTLGLITDEQLLQFCTTYLSCPLFFSLPINFRNPNILIGLEQWLAQGGLSEDQMLSWCQSNLAEPLPDIALQPSFQAPQTSPLSTHSIQDSPESSPQRSQWGPKILRSLMDEISVLWLLFLGVFLVVVSSAVLAASQWNAVPAVGQYGILWVYTFAFWGVSHWLGRRDNLQLTAQTLQLTALLIIPINFWMIDSFQLVQGGVSLIVAGMAGVILSGLMAHTLNPKDRDRWNTFGQGKRSGWIVFANLLLLSWLHWGWLTAGVPPVAIYVGIITTAISTVLIHSEPLESVRARPPTQYPFVDLLAMTPLYGMLLLLLRGIWIAQLPFESMGLAFGLVGGMFCWMGRRNLIGLSNWWWAGVLCLLIGRLVTLEYDSHIQAVFITAITLWAFIDRLVKSWHPGLVWLIFLTGLQGLYPLYELVPEAIQNAIMTQVAAIAGRRGHQPAVLSFLVLPYWWLTLRSADILYQWKGLESKTSKTLKPDRTPKTLVPLVERIALGLGLFLTLLTLGNSLLRTVFLVCVGVILMLRFIHQEARSTTVLMGWIHAVGLGAIASGIDWVMPSLKVEEWAIVCFIGMLGEFVGAAYGAKRWQRSFWRAGLTLATIGYLLILFDGPYLAHALHRQGSPIAATIVWAIPIGLTGLGFIRSFSRQSMAQTLGMIAIFAAQLLCLPFVIPRALGFGLAMLLMGLLSLKMRHSFPAIAAIGSGLLFSINLFYSYVPAPFNDWFCVLLPLLSLGVTGISHRLEGRRWHRAIIYRRACSGWSTALNISLVVGLGLLVFTSFARSGWVSLPMQLGAGITILATLYQLQRRPSAMALYLTTLAVEGTICLLSWLGPWPYDVMAIGNFLASVGAVYGWPDHPKIKKWHRAIVSLLFAGAGLLFGHFEFQTYTGLYTIGAGSVILLIGRRSQEFKGAIYLGMAALSFGLYELLIYQLLQTEGKHPGDALVLLAGVTTLVAIGDRLVARWSDRLFHLSPSQFSLVAHFHWLTASALLVTALLAPMRSWAEVSWLGLTLMLTVYAMTAGQIQTGFIYAGIAQGLGAIAFGLAQILPLSVLGHWGGAIAVLFALGLSVLPWARLGWEPLPGQHMAMILPAGVVALSLPRVGLTSLLLSGAWYFWISQRSNRLRLSYLGIAFGNWAIFRLLDRWLEVTPMGITLLLGCSLLLVVQWEPLLQTSHRREMRHWLRCFALGLMALVALSESDGLFGWSIVTVLAGLAMGICGLILQVRSLLYVGTLLFLVKVVWLLGAFVTDHSFLLWAMGIVLGIVLIWVAATFEARRTQAIAFLDYWVNTLQHWQ